MMSRGKKILVVDDEPAFCSGVARYLQRAGHRVETACHGQDALGLLDVFGPDLVVLDLVMPVMSGTEFIKALHAIPRWAGVPVLLVTARTSEEAAALVEHGDAASALVKSHFALIDVLHEVDRLTADFVDGDNLRRVA